MNFLFHCWEYPPLAGGVGKYIQNMSQALSAAGHSVTVAAGKAEGMPDYAEEHGVAIHRCLERADLYSKHAADIVLELANKYHIDLLEGADHLGCSASLLARTHRPPVVIKCHSCSILHAAHEHAQVLHSWQKWTIRLARLRGWRQAWHEQRSIEQADLLTAPSRKIVEEMIRQGIRLPAKQMIIPNPIAVQKEPARSAEADHPTVLFAGRLDIGKGIQYLPGLLRAVSQHVPDVCLEIAGDDSYARGIGSLQHWLKQCFGQYESQVRWLGYLPAAEVQKALQRAWVVVIPSRWDTFPTILLEAMANAKAAVVSNKGGLPDMAAGSGIPVSDPARETFAEHVAMLLRDVERRKRVGRSGWEKAATCYSPEKVACEYEKVAEEVVKARQAD